MSLGLIKVPVILDFGSILLQYEVTLTYVFRDYFQISSHYEVLDKHELGGEGMNQPHTASLGKNESNTSLKYIHGYIM